AFDIRRQRTVAIKILHVDPEALPDFTPRFLREAQRCKSLSHPHIAQLLDFQLVDAAESGKSSAYLVTEYIKGSTLADYLLDTWGKGNTPSAPVLLKLFTSLCRTLDYAHQSGIIHRDLKPTNI